MAAWRRQLMSVFLLRQLALERHPWRTPCNQLGDAEACMHRAWQDFGFASLASPASTRRLDLEAGNVASLCGRCIQASTWCIRPCCYPRVLPWSQWTRPMSAAASREALSGWTCPGGPPVSLRRGGHLCGGHSVYALLQRCARSGLTWP